MIKKALWISPNEAIGHRCPIFRKNLNFQKELSSAVLQITAKGVYVAFIDGRRIGDFILAPGWTSYKTRLQVQAYDITGFLKNGSELSVIVGHGWYRGRLKGFCGRNPELYKEPAELVAEITLNFSDGTSETVITDNSWNWAESPLISSDIYDGEHYDASLEVLKFKPVIVSGNNLKALIEQEGETVKEHESFKPIDFFVTPSGEKVLDFGQNLTGYVEFTVNAKKGDRVHLSCAETLDSNGNFYTINYRSALSEIDYICKDGIQTYKPLCTFFGFRYIRIDSAPEDFSPDNFRAIAVYSDIKRTGYLHSSDRKLNKLFSNIVWSQKDNFLDVPTDCPQRDERMGWSGDAHVFAKTAGFLFDTEKFFIKWLNDLKADQFEDGMVPNVIPDIIGEGGSPGWGDAACICPWQIYLAYGNKQILENQFESMCKWVDYITSTTTTEFLWTGRSQYGDWLALDAPKGSLKGISNEELIASAFYAYSTELTVKSGKILDRDVERYENLYRKILQKFRETYTEFNTQTECALAINFNLADDSQKVGERLVELVKKAGNSLTTGFIGTPYLLHALSKTGHTDIAYSLLLREEYPSWLFSVKQGATTIWEHWDGIRSDGSFWGKEANSRMNSFNHYAYGAVADWVYSVACGINVPYDGAGYKKIIFAPRPDNRLKYLCAQIETRQGTVVSSWSYNENGALNIHIKTPSPAKFIMSGKSISLEKGEYNFTY